MRPRVLVLGGTRPEIVKLAPLVAELQARPSLEVLYALTGQHHDQIMAGDPIFQASPAWPRPHHVAAWPHASTGDPWVDAAAWARRYHSLLPMHHHPGAMRPDVVVVLGGTASALAGMRLAGLLGASLVHVEAGLRSWDEDQVEERIRRELDRRADLLLCPSALAAAQVQVDARPDATILTVGQTGLDALRRVATEADQLGELTDWLEGKPWALLTLHRQELVSEYNDLANVVTSAVAGCLAAGLVPVWPVHPRVRATYGQELGPLAPAGVVELEPLSYGTLARLLFTPDLRPQVVITDSGGLVEEAYAAGIPAAITRYTTERWEPVAEDRAVLVSPAYAWRLEDLVAELAELAEPPLGCTAYDPVSLGLEGTASEWAAQAIESHALEVTA